MCILRRDGVFLLEHVLVPANIMNFCLWLNYELM